MTHTLPDNNGTQHFPIVGRDSRIDLQKYTTRVHGRDIIDYEKLRLDNPVLYHEIVSDEAEADRQADDRFENAVNLREIERIIASVVIVSSDNKILMGRKDSSRGGVYPDAWHIPGGGVDEDESLEDAAKREALEEVGLDLSNEKVTQLTFVGNGSTAKTLPSGEKVWCNMTFYRFEVRLSKQTADIQARPGDDLVELRWFGESELDHIKLVPGGKQFFREAGYIKS